MEKYIGKVKWFNRKKGYGFITSRDGEDIFVHVSGISVGRKYKNNERGIVTQYLNTGDEVSYNIYTDKKGNHASMVSLILTEVI